LALDFESPNEYDTIRRAAEYGIDISLLIENLQLTPTQRLERMARVIAFFERVGKTEIASDRDRDGVLTLFDALDDEQVEYVIVGDTAATIHGAAPPCAVIELCYARDEINLRHLSRALEPFHPRTRGTLDQEPSRFDHKILCSGEDFYLSTDVVSLNLTSQLFGFASYSDVLANSTEIYIDGRLRSVLNVDALIGAHELSDEERNFRQLLELEALLALKNRKS
jgi:hypothetical protein